MTNRIDIMVDIETLGNKMDSTIIQLAAMAFDIKKGKTLHEFNQVADIEKNENRINVTGSTLEWWMRTNKELFSELLNSGEYSSEDLIRAFHNWIKDIKRIYGEGETDFYLWGNGILFDNAMIRYQMESLKLEYPIFYRNDRDVRTIVDLAGAKSGLSEKELKSKFNDELLVAHNAFDDVVYQIGLVSGCYNMLIK